MWFNENRKNTGIQSPGTNNDPASTSRLSIQSKSMDTEYTGRYIQYKYHIHILLIDQISLRQWAAFFTSVHLIISFT